LNQEEHVKRPTARWTSWIRSALCVAIAASTLSSANAEAPGSPSVAGIRLGDAPAKVTDFLRKQYPPCDHQRSIYHASPGETAGPLAQVAINEGTMNVCQGTPEGPDSTDALVVRFAHPAVDPERGTFEIHLDRHYPDPALASAKQIRYPYDKLLAQLRRQYGKPIDERRDRVASTSASMAKSLGIGDTVKREDYLVRLLWAPTGKLGKDEITGECDCGDRYVRAEIEISRSPVTRPANRYYVVRLALFTRDAGVHRRQSAWDRQWLQPGK
jgi:hypothetical protein